MKSEDSLNKRMEYVQDVAGWKSIIFLSFHIIWQFLLVITIIYVFTMTTSMVVYSFSPHRQIYVLYLCDLLYLLDVMSSILHHLLTSTRKMKNYKPRPWVVILIDCFSLIPFELIYVSVYLPETAHSESVRLFMFLNRSVRIYRCYLYYAQTHIIVQNYEYSNLLTFSQLIIYGYCLSHVAACVFQRLKSEAELEKCPHDRYDCIIINEVNIFFLLSERFIGNEETYNTRAKRLACSIFLTISHFYIFGYMAPMFIFSCIKKLQMFFEFWNRFQRLRIFLSNMIGDETLKKKTLEEFRTVWTFGKGDIEPEHLTTFPNNLQKNAYSDLYWDAFRHSELLHNISYGCKRSLAMKVIGDFYMPGSLFWDIGENKQCMLYLSSGILQIMSEENSNSPIMSFSGGTVLGESTMFFPAISKAILRVATFSEIHVLKAKDFFHVIKDYPADRDIVLNNLKLRLQIAGITRLRKTEMSKVIFNRNMGEIGDFVMDEDDSVKWIKMQFRDIAQMQEAYSKKSQGGNYDLKVDDTMIKQAVDLKSGIDHTSTYLPLLNLGEDIEVLTDLTCLKTSLPWVIDPNSHFMRFWRKMILTLILFCSTVYPAFLGWWPVLPVWLTHISQFISIIYFIDIWLQLSTAIKTKDVVIVQSGAIFRYRLRRLSFYADLISSIPFELIYKNLWEEVTDTEKYLKLSLALSLLKIYNLSIFFSEWCETVRGKFSLRVMIKYLFFFCLILYWNSAFLQYAAESCIYENCEDEGWYKPELEKDFPMYKTLSSAFFSATYILDVPDTLDYDLTFPSVVHFSVILLVTNYVILSWFGDFNAAYILEMTQEIKFKSLLQSVNNFLNDRGIIGRIKKRVLDTMYFQWHYDCGDHLTQSRTMLEDAPEKLKKEVNKETIFKVFRSCDLFHSESETMLWHICKKSTRLVLPSNSVVLTFGVQSTNLYVVYKGFLQVNSFLPKDITQGVAAPILYGPGKIFPVVIALNQMPSGVTARTITDCELIVVGLEDFLTGVIINNSFKDFVDTIKLVDLEPFRNSKLTFSKVSNVFYVPPEDFNAPYRKNRFFGFLLRRFLMRKTIRSESVSFLRWELFRLISIIIAAIVWPILFNLDASRVRTIIIYGLLALDAFGVVDFYIRLHVGYYNKKGIYISHPMSTSGHYLSTSFLLDLIYILPAAHSLYIILENPMFEVCCGIVYSHIALRLFALTRVFLFIINNEQIGSVVPSVKLFGYLLLIFVFLNGFIFLKLKSELIHIYTVNGTLTYELKPDGWLTSINIKTATDMGEMYVLMVYGVFVLLFRSFAFLKVYNAETLAYSIVLPLLGMVFVFWSNAFFITRKTGSKKNFTVYQYHMKSLISFLKTEKAEDTISKEAINHFDHEWDKKGGDDLHYIFSRFPNILEEDLMYPIYKPTLKGVKCFVDANEAFYRILSRVFVEVHFRKGSTIMFAKEVHRNIYFIHSGQCYIGDTDTTLFRGSVMGDIKGKGITNSNIMAQTHVTLLKIKSRDFFVILNDFYNTEMAFFDMVEKFGDDYMESGYNFSKESVRRDVKTWKEVETEKVECEFELIDEKKGPEKEFKKKSKFSLDRLHTFHPQSKISKVLKVIFIIDAIVTAFIIPLIIALRLATKSAIGLMYFLDVVWLVKLFTTLKTSYIDSDTGNLVVSRKKIFKNYVQTSDGFIVDILSVFPFEYVSDLMQYYYPSYKGNIRKYCYVMRLLRLLSLYIKVAKEKKKISLTNRTRWFIIIMRQTIAYNFLTSINLLIATDEKLLIEDDQKEYSDHLIDALIWSYLAMFNLYAGVGLNLFPPENLWQVVFQIFLTLYSAIEKVLLTSEILSIINVALYVKSKKLFKLQMMEKYLAVRDISPALRDKLVSYSCDILDHYKTEVEPYFLIKAPYFIKVKIMEDLYMHYLQDCFVFRNLSSDFLKQLAARLRRNIYFPSDVIVEKGDVESTMFFIHRGEVASVVKDEIYPALDYEMVFYKSGDYFGLLEGIYRSIPYSETYRARTKADLLSLNYFDWEDMRLAFPRDTETLYSRMYHMQIGDTVFNRHSSKKE